MRHKVISVTLFVAIMTYVFFTRKYELLFAAAFALVAVICSFRNTSKNLPAIDSDTLDQVTDKDFIAPRDKMRIIKEDMSDGHLSIVGDYTNPEIAKRKLADLQDGNYEDIFTLCDENGPVDM